MPCCSVCFDLHAAALSPQAQDDLLYLLSDEVCRSLSLCAACGGRARSSAQFVRSARQACANLSASTVDAGLEVWEPHVLERSSDEEKPLHLLALHDAHSTDNLDSTTSGPVKMKKSKKKRKLKEGKSLRNKLKMRDGDTGKKETKENCADQAEELVGDISECSQLRKEGRRVVETKEYKVIRLTPEQIREEMAQRSRSEAYTSALLRCEHCVRWFNFEDVRARHMEKHSPKNGSFECDICHQFCPTRVSFRGHMKSHLCRYECKACGAVKSARQHLLEHHALAHGARAAAGYTCALCGFHCLHRTTLQRHARAHGPAAPPLTCERCGEKFKSLGTLRVHSLLHAGAPRLQCPQCARRFLRASGLRAHERSHGAAPHYCVECDVRFSSRGGLTTHLRRCRRHRADSAHIHECNICKKTFSTAASLAAHTAWAHEGRREHACAACARAYGTRDGLRAHVARAHGRRQGAHPLHPCSYCAKAFKSRDVLARHLRTHTGERPYECGECGHKFAQSSTRATHVRLVHRKLPRRVLPPPEEKEKSRAPAPTRVPEKTKTEATAY